MHERAVQRSMSLYKYIDTSRMYKNGIHPSTRSRMDVTFRLPKSDLAHAFCKGIDAKGYIGLEVSRATDSVWASICNSMSVQDVEELVTFMKQFEKKH